MNPRLVQVVTAAMFSLLAGCAAIEGPSGPGYRPLTAEEGRALVARLMPEGVKDRAGWATDIYAAFAALDIQATPENFCAAIAVTAQESSFATDPAVPGLAAIARNGHGLELEDRLDPHTRATEALLMGLRLAEGIDLPRIAALAGGEAPIDSAAVARLEKLGLIAHEGERLPPLERAPSQPFRQRRPLDQLHDQRVQAVVLLDAVNRRDMRVVERGQDPRFALEA